MSYARAVEIQEELIVRNRALKTAIDALREEAFRGDNLLRKLLISEIEEDQKSGVVTYPHPLGDLHGVAPDFTTPSVSVSWNPPGTQLEVTRYASHPAYRPGLPLSTTKTTLEDLYNVQR